MPSRFVQIHSLTSYPGALLNRDDAGFAKRLPFGGATRTRVSSQCLKRHWRVFEGAGSLAELGIPETYRSRYTFERQIVRPLLEQGLPEPEVRAAVEALRNVVFGRSEKAKGRGKGDAPEAVRTEQVTVLGRPEVDHLRSIARDAVMRMAAKDDAEKVVQALLDKDQQKTLQTMVLAGGVGAALFGRMVTSDILARGDAAVHVAHAFTVHAEESEADYFSAVDDLVREDGELGSGHIGNTELTSGLFYGYVVLDVPLLVSNLTGAPRKEWERADRTLAGRVVEHLVRLVATVSPGAKLGSTAPYAYAQAVLVEAGDAQPRTLANAFLRPVRADRDVLAGAYAALADHVVGLDAMYATGERRRFAGIGAPLEIASRLGAEAGGPLPALAAWAGAQVAGE